MHIKFLMDRKFAYVWQAGYKIALTATEYSC
jgi:hypothetical protein